MNKKSILGGLAVVLFVMPTIAGFKIAELQSLIDSASAQGGGVVVIPPGKWEMGPVSLKSNVTLHLEKGAILLGLTDAGVYRKAGLPALIHTEKAENVAIEGEGIIDGRGGVMPHSDSLPHLVNFRDCRNIRIEDVTLRCGGSWTLNPRRCDGVVIRRVKIWSHVNQCEDGIDVESKNVLIEDCVVDADDDALVFKTTQPDIVVENVEVRNCHFRSSCNAIKFGTESHGFVRNVTIHDCTISAPSAQGRYDWRNANYGIVNYLTGLAGIAIECVDGGGLENVIVRGIKMGGMQTPFFVRLGRRRSALSGRESYLRNLLIENVDADAESRIASSITGVPGLRPRNVCIRDVRLTVPGGGSQADVVLPVPEVEKGYPDANMFNGLILPAFGFYVRHADDVRFENVSIRTRLPDARHAIVVDDAEVKTKIVDVMRVSGESEVVERKKFWKSLERESGYWFCPEAATAGKPPLFVGLGAVRGKPQESAFSECRRRNWAMLMPFSRDVAGVVAEIRAVLGRVDHSRIYLKGDAGLASLALKLVKAEPRLFAGVSVVMPLEEIEGLSVARGTPVDVVSAIKSRHVKVALNVFDNLAVSGQVVPASLRETICREGKVPLEHQFTGDEDYFPRNSRPLIFRKKSGMSRLSLTETESVSAFVPSFVWFDGLPPRSESETHRIILAGDSTLQRRAVDAKTGSWGEALRPYLKTGFEIVNCAIGGRSTKTYMSEWETNVVSQIRPGDYVIIQFGHNDMSKASDPAIDRQTDPDTEYMNNLLRFVADVRHCGGQPILVTSITLYLYNKDPVRWPSYNPLGPWVAAMKRVAVEHDVPIVDMNAATLKKVRDSGSAVSSKWYMISVDGKDWAHPTKLGAGLFAGVFVEEAYATSNKAVGFLRPQQAH